MDDKFTPKTLSVTNMESIPSTGGGGGGAMKDCSEVEAWAAVSPLPFEIFGGGGGGGGTERSG